MFYVTFVYRTLHVATLAERRYYDWCITTPAMLLTLSAFLGRRRYASMRVFLASEWRWMAGAMLSNALMLWVGYLHEVGRVSLQTSSTIGFAALATSFGIVGRYLPERPSAEDRAVLWGTFVVWAAYGLAAMANPVRKNNLYNALDLVSKNAFGLYIALLATRTSTKGV